MVALAKTTQISYNTNLVQNRTIIYVARKANANSVGINWNNKRQIHWSKYQIKESDYRAKTATFTSPNYFDLTTGVCCILIASPYHENFAGEILSVSYDEDTGLYDYQCQDFRRDYMGKMELITRGNITLYRILQSLITRGAIPITGSINKKVLAANKKLLSGLHAPKWYDRSLCGALIRGNPMAEKPLMIIRDKSIIECIQDLVIGGGNYIDVSFNDNGILQLTPYHKKDLFNTGLHLTTKEVANRKFKFDTTNIITSVTVNGSDDKIGVTFGSKALTGGVDLAAYFGNLGASISTTTESTTVKKTSSSNVKSTSSNKNTNTSKNTNPYGKKAKKIWICADNGSGDMKASIISLLRKNGWSVHDSGTGSNIHYTDFFDVTSDYQVLAVVDNGFDPACIIEPYEGSIKSTLASKGIVYCFMFDTRDWTDPNGMKPYQYGNFKNMYIGRAWDDNYSNFSGKMDVYNYFQKNKIRYCAHPTASGIVNQFLAGGLLKYS